MVGLPKYTPVCHSQYRVSMSSQICFRPVDQSVLHLLAFPYILFESKPLPNRQKNMFHRFLMTRVTSSNQAPPHIQVSVRPFIRVLHCICGTRPGGIDISEGRIVIFFVRSYFERQLTNV